MQIATHSLMASATTTIARISVAAVWPLAWWLARASYIAWGDIGDSPWDVAAALTLACGVAGFLVSLYLGVTSLSLIVAAVLAPHRAVNIDRRIPGAWRRIVVTAIGGAVAASIATGAMAVPSPAPAPAPESDFTVSSAGWIALPTSLVNSGSTGSTGSTNSTQSPVAPIPTRAPASNDASPDSARMITVRRGDSLWVICANLLPQSATEADIARAWPMLYRANKSVIGDNPGLIYAGQTLSVPTELLA